MTNVHWKFQSVPLESVCESLILTPSVIHNHIVLTGLIAWSWMHGYVHLIAFRMVAGQCDLADYIQWLSRKEFCSCEMI